MIEYESHFHFTTTIQTHGSDENSVMENIYRKLDDRVINGISEVICAGTDFEVEKLEEVENGWYEATLKWNSSYSFIEADSKDSAKNICEEMITTQLEFVSQILKKQGEEKRFELIDVEFDEVYEVLEDQLVY